MLVRYLEFASRTWVLWLSFILMNAFSFGVFRMLPDLPGLVIDAMPGYTQEDLFNVLTQLGETGRQSYLIGNALDMIFPLFYGTFFIGFLYRMRARPGLGMLAAVPAVLVVVDYVENVQIRMILHAYPDITTEAARLASYTTLTKQGLILLTFGLFAVTALFALVRAVRDKSED